MKYLKRFDNLNEAVGVPTGITDLAQKLYDSIIERLDMKNIFFNKEVSDKYTVDANEIELSFDLKLSGKINDFEINDFSIKILIDEINRTSSDNAELSGAYFNPNTKIDRKNFHVEYLSDGKINLGMKFDFPWSKSTKKEFWTKSVKDILLNNKAQVVSTLGHELMHSYDLAFIKSGREFRDVAKYSAISKLRFGIPTVDYFFYYLYFISKTESIVRSAEIASRMEVQGVTKDDFLKFITNNKTWKTLKEISEWTYQKFDDKLLESIDLIRERLESSDIELNNQSDEEVVETLKDLILNNIIGSKLDSLSTLLRDPKYNSDQFLALLTGKEPEEDPDLDIKNEFFQNFLENLKKDMKNSDYYFTSKEKMFKFESKKLLKKISKLFSMAKDTKINKLQSKISNKVVSKTESIINWEKYQESMGIKPKISNNKFL